MRILSIGFFFLLTLNSYCQYRNALFISGGIADPVGNFRSNDGGAALTGVGYNIGYNRQLTKSLYFAVLLANQSFKINETAIVSGTNWRTSSILVGPMWSISTSESNNAFFQPRFLIGQMSARSPNATIGATTIPSASGDAFAFLIGAGLRLDLTKRASLFFNLDYLTAKPTFTHKILYSNGQSVTTSFDQQISAISFSIGLGVRF